MKKCEFDYEMVSSGMEAVKQVYESTFDLCLMDIEMPILTGDKVSILIRHITENLPIIAVTADTEFIKNIPNME